MRPSNLATTVRAIHARMLHEQPKKNAARQVVTGVLHQMALARKLPPHCHPLLINAVDDRVQQMLQDPSLKHHWHDPLSAGWVLQYINDPARAALDAQILRGDKISPADLSTKTQVFTERYLIQWIIQNSLGQLWLEICNNNGWINEIEKNDRLESLARQQTAWRKKRQRGQVPPDAQVPDLSSEDQRWVYHTKRTVHPTSQTPSSLRDVRILDPACGGGHFLIECFDTLFWMYKEEAAHRGAAWNDDQIRRWIIEDNLFGIDIDSLAVQTTAAALQLHAQQGFHTAPLRTFNLVAADDPLGFLLPHGHARTTTLLRRQDTSDLGFSSTTTMGDRLYEILEGKPFHIVLGNPPYQSMGRTTGMPLLEKHYPEGRHDLYAAFLQRSLQRCGPGGRSALLTMRGWMFIQRFAPLRTALLSTAGLELIGDIGQGAFSALSGEIVSASISIFRRDVWPDASLAIRLDEPDTKPHRSAKSKRASLQCGPIPHPFSPAVLMTLPGQPLVYWWTPEFIGQYKKSTLLGDESPIRQGMATGDNGRFLRRPWEVHPQTIFRQQTTPTQPPRHGWVPYIKGAAGKSWIEPLDDILRWEPMALAVHAFVRDGRQRSRPQNEAYYFKIGTCFSKIGRHFSARMHRYASVFDVAGSTVFTASPEHTTCLLNSGKARQIIADLNPTVNFQVGDVKRLPILPIAHAPQIFALLETEFSIRERHRETSVEFLRPGPHAWDEAQSWAQNMVDSPNGRPVEWKPRLTHPTPNDHLSFAIGVAIGRFDADRGGICSSPPENALPNGILYLSTTRRDSLLDPAATPILEAWRTHGDAVSGSLRAWLRNAFFPTHCHRYSQRPIYLPISSRQKNFVAFISIHQWSANTLQVLLSSHLEPDLVNTSGAERAELLALIQATRACAERGPPPSLPGTPPRENDARLALDINDGVRVNSAAIWPLLNPQWKKPAVWWNTLALGTKRPDMDWSQVARRYFPSRVAARCVEEPSMAWTHGTLWQHHPGTAWKFELRLLDTLCPDFSIDEAHADRLRRQFLYTQPDAAFDILRREILRRHTPQMRAVCVHHPQGSLQRNHPIRTQNLESSLTARLGCPVLYTEGTTKKISGRAHEQK